MITSLIKNPNISFVFINIYISTIGFVRSLLFMKHLDMNELGIISLIQTVMMFIALLQFGLLNGGYRIFALDNSKQQHSVNNIVFTYFVLLGFMILLLWLSLYVLDVKLILNEALLLFALLLGVLALINTWLTNTLLGKRLIKNINSINFISGSASLLLMPLISFGIVGAIIMLACQPLVFILIALVKHRELRPTRLDFKIKSIRYILSFGFIPFLSGIFAQLNLQIERWSIVNILNTSALGEFYLVFLYSTLFMLIPTSILNLFFPKAISSYEKGDMIIFKSLLRKHVFMLITYVLVIVFLSVSIMPFLIQTLLPQHFPNIKYAYYILPGLIALVLCDPLSIILNASVKLKPMLYAGIIMLVVNLFLIWGGIYLNKFNLTNMAMIKTIVNLIPFILYTAYIVRNYKQLFKIGLC